ncbi:MAG: hypothetical protein ACI4U4_00350 [Bacilli bacterium]
MKPHIVIPLIVLFVLTTFSVAYSAFSDTLFIYDIGANVRIKSDVRITGMNLDSVSNGAVSSYEEYNVKSITSNVSLPNSNSTVTYLIEVTNFGNAEVGIFDISGLPSNLEYQLSNYNLKDKICDTDNNCTLGIKKVFSLTIGYKSYTASDTNYNLNLSFEFRQFHSVSYFGIDNASNYPSEVMDGDTLNVTFVDQIPDYIEIPENIEFTYQNGVLKVENVTQDLTINCTITTNLDFAITVDDDANSVTIASDKISSTTPVTVNELLNMEFGGMNLTSKSISRIDVIYTYTSSTGATQSINCILTTSSNSYTKTVSFRGKQTNATVTATFDELNLSPRDSFTIQNSATNLKNGNINLTKNEIIVYFE